MAKKKVKENKEAELEIKEVIFRIFDEYKNRISGEYGLSEKEVNMCVNSFILGFISGVDVGNKLGVNKIDVDWDGVGK